MMIAQIVFLQAGVFPISFLANEVDATSKRIHERRGGETQGAQVCSLFAK